VHPRIMTLGRSTRLQSHRRLANDPPHTITEGETP
jgi:hypothetical protein